jgi:histidyl-tRNA synthetase
MTDAPRIEPRTLQGFRDYPPEAMIPRERLIDAARRVYRSYGFSPIDTPALEYLEILTGKGGEETDKQIYNFEDHGGRRVGLRFDLTVPLARFAAQHANELPTPFKPYHIAAVWRGERPQAGRFREFMQCDFDTLGTRSVVADIETVLVIHDLLREIGLKDFSIRLNNRMVLSGLLERLGLAERDGPVLRALDKLGKLGPQGVAAEMVAAAGASLDQARQILDFVQISGTSEQVLAQVESLLGGNETGLWGVARLREILAAAAAAGVPHARLRLDLAIARGLDYYTGTVLETFLDALPAIGSICSGGRYDNLAGMYTSRDLPGIGASLGLDRLLAALEQLGLIEKVATPAAVFIPYFDPDRLHDYLRLAALIRAAGIGCEVFPEPKRLGQQLKYADRRGFRVALIAGADEFNSGVCQVKDLARGRQQDVPVAPDAAELLAAVRRILELGVRS